jgi:ArsR family transcriptional regulator, arsenate/arsenite/antimonite-responsive transcriptional repressor
MAMPVLLDETGTTSNTHFAVAPSAAAELFWVMHGLEKGGPHRELQALAAPPADLVKRVRAFWEGGEECYGELFLLAEGGGELLGEDPGRVLRAIESNPSVRLDLPLRSESQQVREGTLDRVRRLREDAVLRASYVQLLAECWDLVAAEWERDGRDAVAVAVQRLEARTAAGTPLAEVLRGTMAILREPWWSQAIAAGAEGRLALTPGYFSGKFLAWDLEKTYLVGCQAQPEDDAERARREARRLAPRLKVLADPTRLAMLVYLAGHPATVTEVARAFGVAQPTASTHLRVLRDAGLVSGREEGRGALVVERSAVDDLVRDAVHLLVGDEPPSLA